VPQVTSTVFPVDFLPETGIREARQKTAAWNSQLLLLALASFAAMALFYWGKKRS
jgi:hypothetical protein